MSKRRTPECGWKDVQHIAVEAREILSRLPTDEGRVHPSIPIPSAVRGRFDRWLNLLRTGALHEATSEEWWPNPHVEPLLDGCEGILATLEALSVGLQRCSRDTALDTASFSAQLVGARTILSSIPFCIEDHRRSLITAALSLTLASTNRSCIRRAIAYYEVFDADLLLPITPGIQSIALGRVYDDLRQGSVRTFRHFMESPFRNGNRFPIKLIRDAALEGLAPALDRVFAKPSKSRFESLAFIAALGCANVQEVWETLRPTLTRMIKIDPQLAGYAIDLFFPVSIKGAPHADDFLRREIHLFFSLDQTIATRMQRHFTGYFPLDWEHTLRGRVPPLPPTARGLQAQSDASHLKHHLVSHYVPARRSHRIPDGIELIPSQATALGRLTAEFFSIGCGAYITLVPDETMEPQYAFRPHTLVVGTSCIDARSHPGELYLALGKAFHHVPRNGSLIRVTPAVLSSISLTQHTDDQTAETHVFSTVSSLLFEVRWLSRRLLSLLRGDEGSQVHDERLIINHYLRRTRDRLLAAETAYRHCRERLVLITQYFQGEREGAISLCHYPEWPGIYTGALGLSLERGIATIHVPLPDYHAIAPEELDQLLFDELARLDPILRAQFDETIGFITQSLTPYGAVRSLIDFAHGSERRRSRGAAIRHFSQRSRSLVSRAVGTMKACIGR